MSFFFFSHTMQLQQSPILPRDLFQLYKKFKTNQISVRNLVCPGKFVQEKDNGKTIEMFGKLTLQIESFGFNLHGKFA